MGDTDADELKTHLIKIPDDVWDEIRQNQISTGIGWTENTGLFVLQTIGQNSCLLWQEKDGKSKFWKSVEKASEEVKDWPDWKKTGVVTRHDEDEFPFKEVTKEELQEALEEGAVNQRQLYEEFKALRPTAEDMNMRFE